MTASVLASPWHRVAPRDQLFGAWTDPITSNPPKVSTPWRFLGSTVIPQESGARVPPLIVVVRPIGDDVALGGECSMGGRVNSSSGHAEL
jgi:hypothetical protein